MKIAHLNFFENSGGAAIAASRLHRGLLNTGIESTLWFVEGKGALHESQSIISHREILLFRLRKSLAWRVSKLISRESFRSFSIFPSSILKTINESNADVVHLHWINCEMLSVPQIARIRKPLVWTFHDMWPLCGGQHYADDNTFNREFSKFNSLAQLTTPTHTAHHSQSFRPLIASSIDRLLYSYKLCNWRNLHPSVICPSNWLAKCAKRSRLTCFHSPLIIPNGLDVSVFSPGDKATCRRALNLPLNTNIILFGAHNPDDPIKGLNLLHESVSCSSWRDTCIVAFGSKSGINIGGLPTKWLGAVKEERVLSQIYSAADVLAFPSIQENLPNTIAEALACGLPVVAFRVGGIPDLIVDSRNGYLVDPYSTELFGSAIKSVLVQNASRRLSESAREHALAMLDVSKCARTHVDLYQTILTNATGQR